MCISLCILRQMALSVLDGESVSIWLFVYPSITCNISDSTHWSLINVTEWRLLWSGSFTNALITERDILILSGGTHAILKSEICHSCGNECLTAVTLSTYVSEDAHPGYKASKFQIWQTFILIFLPALFPTAVPTAASGCIIKFSIASDMHNDTSTACIDVQSSKCALEEYEQ